MFVFNYLIHTNSLGYLGWDARENPAEECNVSDETYRQTDAYCRPKVNSLPSSKTAVLSVDPRTAGN